MRLAMIGTGYVGLVSGACFADFGHSVICIDKDAGKIAALKRDEIPIFTCGQNAIGVKMPLTAAYIRHPSPSCKLKRSKKDVIPGYIRHSPPVFLRKKWILS